MAEINAQWANEEVPTTDDLLKMDTGFEEVTEDEANISLSGVVLSDPANHSLPAPEPRKAYNDKYASEIRKRRCTIWGVAALLIMGVVAAFVGGFLATKQRKASGGTMSISDSTGAMPGEGGQGDVPLASYNYRRTRRMTKRRHAHTKGHNKMLGNGKKEFDLTQVFGR
mmetsp:Transcript_34550/g.103263  ORF Transcript_34550/g.103263 Transcript_34550/m.103263 type:complete len:169 (-) Transcript_34550:464-970(-)|eukprot:CAMPEP_0113559138 /NCGR_PEP_ID=MMETSP0015_2-20120614/18729_1 /TAXON_ID=2838 /ORGANISM="Odontella" /LENGTH=168 /DNA_ID=CAMNT_0000460739 /DNA_START=139 /DNA_END=645 /DNA_ORIENTATION=- /assembly_acc=CAM_ASM_000160